MRPRLGHRFRGLALRLSLIVGISTLVATLFVSAISLHTIRGFLSGKIDRRFSGLLWTANEHLELYYAQRRLDVETFAASGVFDDGLPELLGPRGRDQERAHRDVVAYLAYVLDSFSQYESVFVLDSEGGVLARVGKDRELPDPLRRSLSTLSAARVSEIQRLGTERLQLISAPIHLRGRRAAASLHAVLDFEWMIARLREAAEAGSTQLYLVDRFGDALGGTGGIVGLEGVTPSRAGEEPGLTVLTDAEGRSWVASAAELGGHGWTLVVREPYDTVFAPLRTALQRVGGFNLLAAALASLGSLLVVAWRVSPILDLADGARRISEGETEVHIPEERATAEIRLLTRAFNEMSGRLTEKQAQIEDASRRLISQNEELRIANEVLEQLSITDGLTRLHNHRHFQDQFAREAKRADRTGEPLSLILIDIDDFKALNDELGHAAGDAVLQRVAQVMTEELRDTDVLARYGGEEFALLAPQCDLEGAVALAEKLRMAVAAAEFPVVGPGGRVHTTVSVGVAEHGGDAEATFHAADRALYEAKAAGKDCVISAGRARG